MLIETRLPTEEFPLDSDFLLKVVEVSASKYYQEQPERDHP